MAATGDHWPTKCQCVHPSSGAEFPSFPRPFYDHNHSEFVYERAPMRSSTPANGAPQRPHYGVREREGEKWTLEGFRKVHASTKREKEGNDSYFRERGWEIAGTDV